MIEQAKEVAQRLLTDEEIKALTPDKNCKLCFPGGELKYHGEDHFEPFARAIEAAVLERLTKVDVEPVAYWNGSHSDSYFAKQYNAPGIGKNGIPLVPASALTALRADNERLKEIDQHCLGVEDELRAQLEQAQADAARYRWLREQNADLEAGFYVGNEAGTEPGDITWVGSDLDASIDAARAALEHK